MRLAGQPQPEPDQEPLRAQDPACLGEDVTSRPDDYYGEEIVAVVVLRAGCVAGAAELDAIARTRIAATKVPRQWAFVDALPLGPSAKVQRRALRQQLVDGTLPITKPPR